MMIDEKDVGVGIFDPETLPLVISPSTPQPLKVSSIFTCATSLSSLSGSLITLIIGKSCSNGYGNLVTGVNPFDR